MENNQPKYNFNKDVDALVKRVERLTESNNHNEAVLTVIRFFISGPFNDKTNETLHRAKNVMERIKQRHAEQTYMTPVDIETRSSIARTVSRIALMTLGPKCPDELKNL